VTPSNDAPSTLILVTREGMGDAEPELRRKLIGTYLTLLDKNGMLPGAIAFYGDGVRLVVEGSPVLEVLGSLESKGVHLVICKTCLEHYGLAEKVKVGVVGGMTDIIAAEWSASKVISV